MNTRNCFASAAMLSALLAVAACGGAPPAVTNAPAEKPAPEMRPVASVLDLMLGQIDPAADFLWESVATISGPKGVEERQPRTDAEWADVRYKALMVIEGANMLLVEGRQVAHPGQQLEEPGGATDYTPAQAQAEIDKDRASYVAFAHALQDAAGMALTATEKRDADALLEAGGHLDEACEGCHKRFWYPNSPTAPGA